MALTLLRRDDETILRQMLPAEPHSIASPQAGMQQHLKGQSQRRPNLVMLPEFRDVIFRPSAMAGGFQLHPLGDDNGIIGAHPGRHGIVHHRL
ncbi:MAG: hypothetical protein WBB98_15535 [Xanthobacteraceae bacterium]